MWENVSGNQKLCLCFVDRYCFLQLYICFEFIYQGAGDLVVYCSRLWPVNDALECPFIVGFLQASRLSSL